MCRQASICIAMGDLTSPDEFSCQINVKLLNGPCLFSQNYIPLAIEINQLRGDRSELRLNDFQTMLIETTEIRVGDSIESLQRCWIIQTMTNMNESLFGEGMPLGDSADLPSSIWSAHPVPSSITPSFEICNIKRTYQLEVRLGFLVGSSKVERR